MDRREFAREFLTGVVGVPVALAGPSVTSSGIDESPADQLLAVLKARHPDRLSDDQWKQVRGKIEAQLQAAKALGAFPLQNSDEPATVFEAVGSGQ